VADFMTRAERSKWMVGIRGKNTKPEILVRQFLNSQGFRYRLHVKDLPGRPDLVLPRYRTIVFVDGCFWHGHACQGGRVPGSNSEFWVAKITANRARDRRNQRTLKTAGWQVLRVWECQLATKKVRSKTLVRLAERIKSSL